MTYLVRELLDAEGRSPFGIWFKSLDSIAAAKVSVAVARMEQGNLASIQWFRGIGEFRINWGPGLRIYLARDDSTTILLLGGGRKRRQQSDIERALTLWEEHKRQRQWKKGGD